MRQFKIIYEFKGRREFCVVDKKAVALRLVEEIRRLKYVKWCTDPITDRVRDR